MQILSIRCGLTRNLGNFESAKLEVEAAPSDGQSSVELLEEVKEYLEKALPEGGAGDGKATPVGGKGKKSDGKGKKSDGKGKKSDGKKAGKASPWTAADETHRGELETAEKAAAGKDDAAPAPAPVKKSVDLDAARIAFNIVSGSDTLEELLRRFNEFRDPGLGYRTLLTKKEWAKSVNAVQDCYKSLTTADSDAGVMHDLVAAINSERNVAR